MNKIKITQKVLFDFEVYPNWWCVVFKDVSTGKTKVVTSDNSSWLHQIKQNTLLIGFNIKKYDMVILSAILQGATTQELHKLSVKLVKERDKAEDKENTKTFQKQFDYYNKFSFQDLWDDWRFGSLKKFEANIGMDIKECPISFDDRRNLTNEDKKLIIDYCVNDIKATEKLYNYRKDYLKSKEIISHEFRISLNKVYKQSQPKLACTVLDCKKRIATPEPNIIPKHLRSYCVKYIDEDLVDCVMNATEPFVEDLFNNEVIFGDGGLHSVIDNDIHVKSNDVYQIIGIDVASYYPALMIEGGLMTRASRKPWLFKQLRDKRVKLKDKNGFEDLCYALKILINSLYGAMGNKHLTAFDPCVRASVCRTGQLLLVTLAYRLYNECNAEIIQTNTDGILVNIRKDKIENMKAIVKDWENVTGFTMEYVYVREVWQKNVNNYLEVDVGGKIKLKGSWLGQAFPMDYEVKKLRREPKPLKAPICQRAVVKYLVDGIPIEETIHSCDRLLEFCFTTSFTSKYDYCYHDIIAEKKKVLKVNRVYATTDKSLGKLYKVKKSYNNTGQEKVTKIGSLPRHCRIVNEDVVKKSIPSDLNYSWYIRHAQRLLSDFEEVA